MNTGGGRLRSFAHKRSFSGFISSVYCRNKIDMPSLLILRKIAYFRSKRGFFQVLMISGPTVGFGSIYNI